MVKYYINEKPYTFKISSTVLDVLKREKKDYRRFLACKVNNIFCDLNQKIRNGDRIRLLDITNKEAFKCYQNSLSFLLSAVTDEYFPERELVIEHSFVDGFYCRFSDHQPVRKNDLNKLSKIMKVKIGEHIPFVKI